MAPHAQTGVVMRIYRDKGFGFVADDTSQLQYFFHRSMVGPQPDAFDLLEVGDHVTFDGDAADPKGPRVRTLSVMPA